MAPHKRTAPLQHRTPGIVNSRQPPWGRNGVRFELSYYLTKKTEINTLKLGQTSFKPLSSDPTIAYSMILTTTPE